MSSLHYSELCRLCLINERVSIPIFDGESGIQSLCLKIGTCLPIKVSPEDILPKNICNDCFYKVENQYQFWISTANAEKQLLQWFSNSVSAPEVDKGLPAMATDQNNFKTEMDLDPSSELSKSLSQVEAVLAGETTNVPDKEEEDEEDDESEEEGSNSEESDDDGDNAADDGAKDEGDSDEAYDEELEPTTFVNVSFECDEAGPSGTQQQQQRAPPAPSTSTSAPAPSGNHYSFPEVDQDHGFNVTNKPQKETKCVQRAKPFKKQIRLFTPSMSPLKCGYANCNKVFLKAYAYTMHFKTHDPLPEAKKLDPLPEDNYCTVCKKAYRNNITLCSHLSKVKFTEAPPPLPKKLQCQICLKVFEDSSKLNKHKIAHSTERPFSCEVCHKQFKRKFEVVKHNKIHTGEKEHACDMCEYATLNKTYLEYHKMRRHSRLFEFICDICGKRVLTPSDLKTHKDTHNEKQFKCSSCDKAFHKKSHLVLHAQIHDPNRGRMQCEVCGKSYATKSVLVRHMDSHSAEAKFKCEVCGKVVTSSSSLIIHRRMHTGEKPFGCDVCSKTFTSMKYLETHKRVHSGEKPFRCDDCGKAFSQRSTLTIHRRYHTGLRPYACELCPKSFVTKTLLNAHEKRHLSAP